METATVSRPGPRIALPGSTRLRIPARGPYRRGAFRRRLAPDGLGAPSAVEASRDRGETMHEPGRTTRNPLGSPVLPSSDPTSAVNPTLETSWRRGGFWRWHARRCRAVTDMVCEFEFWRGGPPSPQVHFRGLRRDRSAFAKSVRFAHRLRRTFSLGWLAMSEPGTSGSASQASRMACQPEP